MAHPLQLDVVLMLVLSHGLLRGPDPVGEPTDIHVQSTPIIIENDDRPGE